MNGFREGVVLIFFHFDFIFGKKAEIGNLATWDDKNSTAESIL